MVDLYRDFVAVVFAGQPSAPGWIDKLNALLLEAPDTPETTVRELQRQCQYEALVEALRPGPRIKQRTDAILRAKLTDCQQPRQW